MGRSGLSLVCSVCLRVHIRRVYATAFPQLFPMRGDIQDHFLRQRFVPEGKQSQIPKQHSHPVMPMKIQGQILVAHWSHHRSHVDSATSGAGAELLKCYLCVNP